MRHPIRTIILLCFCFPIGVSAQSKEPLETYIDPKSGMMVQYPRTWQLDHTEHLWMNFTLLPPQDETTVYPENFTLTHQHLADPGVSVESICRANEDRIGQVAQKAKLINKKEVSLQGIPACMLEYSGNLVKNGTEVPLHWKHWYFKVGNDIYTLSFICQEDHLKRLSPVAEQIVASFRQFKQ